MASVDITLVHGDTRTYCIAVTDDEDEPLHVYADPAGHPFCIFVG